MTVVCGPEGPIRARTCPPPPPIRAVLFDFSGTLFQISGYAERIRAALPEPVGEPEMEEILTELETGLQDPVVIEAQRGRDVSAKAHRHAFTTWYASAPALAPYTGSLYGQLQDPGHWRPYADAEATLARLAERGIAMGVVSDVGWNLRPTFAHHGLADHFTSWVHSYEHASEKPDPHLFRYACGELGVPAEETLMVGDHPSKDGGAATAGLRAYVLPAGASPGSARGLDAVLRLL
jgi:HAD superfamily hydrolase (TIGR01509 family)